jgi:radical S-adenosyl methionine domain-containing protein 2
MVWIDLVCYTQYGVLFKLNTVVNAHNYMEDMNDEILEIAPKRWKVFQCLPVQGENVGEAAVRNVAPFVISAEQFEEFIARHNERCKHVLVKESNEMMQSSYLILDEYMRFLDCSQGGKQPGPSILDVGVQQAIGRSGFDERMFKKRGGIYQWSKKDLQYDW